MLMINTGDGKGKTTAAIGQAIRALACGWKVCMIQLFKGENFYGEQKILQQFESLHFLSFAPRHPFCFPETDRESVVRECGEALRAFERAAGQKQYRLIILEEFNIALRDGFLATGDLLEALGKTDPDITVLVTGRGAPPQLIERADLVTEMKEIRHPYRQGISARKGIEF